MNVKCLHELPEELVDLPAFPHLSNHLLDLVLIHHCALLFLSVFGIVNFVTRPFINLTPNQEIASQINVIVSNVWNLKLYVVFMHSVSRIIFLFFGQQDIVNYWDSTSKMSRTWNKRLVPKTSRIDQWEVFAKMSFRYRLICSAVFFGLTLFACLPYTNSSPVMASYRFLLWQPNSFLRVCLTTLFASVLTFFYH